MFLQQNVMKDPVTSSQMEALLKQIAPVKALVGKRSYQIIIRVVHSILFMTWKF